MKGSLLLTLLGTAVLLVGGLSFALGTYYGISMVKTQQTVRDIAKAKNLEVIGSSLVAKSLEYRQKNPNIERILRECNVVHPALSNVTQNAQPAGR